MPVSDRPSAPQSGPASGSEERRSPPAPPRAGGASPPDGAAVLRPAAARRGAAERGKAPRGWRDSVRQGCSEWEKGGRNPASGAVCSVAG